MEEPNPALRRAVRPAQSRLFRRQFSVALAISSVALFADSIDFLEDASVNALILVALGWSLRNRAKAGMALALILLVPGLASCGPRGRS